MNRHRSFATVARGDETQRVALLIIRVRLLLVSGREVAMLGQNPDLKKMNRVALRWIHLAVQHAGSRAHALHVAASNHRSISHVVLMGELAGHDDRHDFHVAMSMASESDVRLYAILIDHAQRSEAHELR